MQFRSLPGLTSYEDARRIQLELLEARARVEGADVSRTEGADVASSESARSGDGVQDTVLFLEHEPVITRGRGLQFTGVARPRHMPLPAALPPGIAFAESERGGDLTYHGPGQLVIYPIFKLNGRGFGPHRDVGGYLRRLEQVIVNTLSAIGVPGARARENATGVWVGDRKVASIGIAVRKWVTYHGVAINVVNDLRPFHSISPCGFEPEVMTRLADLLPAGGIPAGEDWRPWLEREISRQITQLVAESGVRSVAECLP